MKKFWKYFTILILLLTGLFCVGLLYLFFVKGSTLFNITYVSHNKTYLSKSYTASEVSTIKLNSRAYRVNIVPAKSEEISASVQARTLGYTLVKNSNVSVTSKLVDGILTIEVDEPYGIAFRGDSFIELKIPENYSPNLILNNKYAKTTLNNEKIKLSSLSYTTKSGDFEFKQGSILGTLDLNLNKANFNIYKSASLNNPNVRINLTSGKFRANHHDLNIVNVIKNKRGVVELKSCFRFEMNSKSSGGKLDIETLQHADITSSDTNVYIKNLYGGSIKLTESGKIKVTNIKGISTLETSTGSITVKNAETELTTISDSGNQSISNATKRVSAESTYGNISIKFAETAPSYVFSSNPENIQNYRSIFVFTKNGKVTASGVDNATVKITDKGNGRVYLTMHNVLGNNVIEAKKGEVKVIVAQTAQYHLTTESTNNGKVYVNVGQFAVNGYTTPEKTTNLITNSQVSTVVEHTLDISTTSGDLTVMDELVNEIN